MHDCVFSVVCEMEHMRMNNLFMIDLTTVVGCCFAYFFFVWYALPKIVYNSIPFVKFSNCTLCFFLLFRMLFCSPFLSVCYISVILITICTYDSTINIDRIFPSCTPYVVFYTFYSLYFSRLFFFYYYIFMCRAMILLWFTRWESFAMRICAILCVLYTATVHSIEWLCYIGYMVMHVSI